MSLEANIHKQQNERGGVMNEDDTGLKSAVLGMAEAGRTKLFQYKQFPKSYDIVRNNSIVTFFLW